MRFVEDCELEESQIIYPSPSNPRLKGLISEDPGIIALADSIKRDGQLQRIIVQKIGDKYETLDGDRRCVAIFKVLKWKTIKASLYEMNDLEALRVRLIANIQREDLTSVEKGKYCFELFYVLARTEKLIGEEAWSNRSARSKLLAQISMDVNASPATIINWIRLWQTYPVETQKLIASNKEDLRRGLVPPSLAMEAVAIARRLHVHPQAVLNLAIKNQWTTDDLAAAARSFGDTPFTFDRLTEVITTYRNNHYRRNIVFDACVYEEIGKKAKAWKIRFDDYINLLMQFALENPVLLDNFIILKLRRSRNEP
jgi:ParB/RepB/Spo0J family partition protein